MNHFHPCPKEKPVLLSPAKRRKLKLKLYYGRAMESCETCRKWLPLVGTVFNAAHLSHIIPRSLGGDTPDNCKIECYEDHIIKRHGPKWSNSNA